MLVEIDSYRCEPQEFFLCYVFSDLPWRLTPHGNIAALCLPSEKNLLQAGAIRFWKRGYFSPRNLPIIKNKDLPPLLLTWMTPVFMSRVKIRPPYEARTLREIVPCQGLTPLPFLAFTFSTKFCKENYAYSQNANIIDLIII